MISRACYSLCFDLESPLQKYGGVAVYEALNSLGFTQEEMKKVLLRYPLLFACTHKRILKVVAFLEEKGLHRDEVI